MLDRRDLHAEEHAVISSAVADQETRELGRLKTVADLFGLEFFEAVLSIPNLDTRLLTILTDESATVDQDEYVSTWTDGYYCMEPVVDVRRVMELLRAGNRLSIRSVDRYSGRSRSLVKELSDAVGRAVEIRLVVGASEYEAAYDANSWGLLLIATHNRLDLAVDGAVFAVAEGCGVYVAPGKDYSIRYPSGPAVHCEVLFLTVSVRECLTAMVESAIQELVHVEDFRDVIPAGSIGDEASYASSAQQLDDATRSFAAFLDVDRFTATADEIMRMRRSEN